LQKRQTSRLTKGSQLWTNMTLEVVQSGTHGRHNVPQVRHLNCLAQCLHCPEGLRVMNNIEFATHLCKTHPVLRKVPVISRGLVATLLVSRPRGSCRRPFIIIKDQDRQKRLTGNAAIKVSPCSPIRVCLLSLYDSCDFGSLKRICPHHW
jgi:hypothetical protein